MAGEQVFHLIERLGSLLRSEQRTAGSEHGLQPVHIQALDYLGRCNRYSDTAAALGQYLGATKGTTSQSLLVLQNKGLIKKTPDREDRRITHLALTAKGKRLLEKLNPPAAWQALLDEPDRLDLEAQLSRLLTRLQKNNARQTFGLCHTCRHFLAQGDHYRCGLTQETLSEADSLKICQEHTLD